MLGLDEEFGQRLGIGRVPGFVRFVSACQAHRRARVGRFGEPRLTSWPIASYASCALASACFVNSSMRLDSPASSTAIPVASIRASTGTSGSSMSRYT